MSKSAEEQLLELLDAKALKQEQNRLRRLYAKTHEETSHLPPEHWGVYKWQRDFHNAGAENVERAILASNQSGKTRSCAAELACHLTGWYPDWWQGHRFNAPIEALACGTTNEDTKEIVQRALLGTIGEDRRPDGTGWIPADAIHHRPDFRQCGVQDVVDNVRIRHISGRWSRLKFRSYQQGHVSFQGVQFNFCVCAGELVSMADGTLKKIEDVAVGDMVLSVNGKGTPKIRRVLAVHKNGVKECIRVESRHGTPITVTPDHMVFRGNQLSNKARADEIDKVAQIIPGCYWPKNVIDRDESWYVWSALAVSEGSYSQRKVTNGDESLMGMAMAILPKEARVRKKTFNNGHVPDWYLYWDEFWNEIKPALSHEKEIPDWVFRSSKERVRLFLRWIYAGDGWASGKSVVYATTSYNLAVGIHVLLNRMGIRSGIMVRPPKGNWREQYWVSIHKASQVVKFIDEIGIESKADACAKVRAEAVRRIENKARVCAVSFGKPHDGQWAKGSGAKRFKRYKNTTSVVRKRFSVGAKDVYDLTVEGEHRFLIGTSMVSNCWVDEEPEDTVDQRPIFGELQTRLFVRKGLLVFSRTPLFGMTPIIKHFMDGGKGVWYKNVTLDDCPHFTPEQREDMIARWPEHERDTRARGVPLMGQGAVFPISDKEIVIEPRPIPDHWRRICGIDFGIDHPATAVWIAYDADADIVYVYDCYRQSGQTPVYHSGAIRKRGDWIPVAWPHDGLNRDKGSGKVLMEMYDLPGQMLGLSARYEDDKGGGQNTEPVVLDILERMRTGRWKVFSTCAEWLEEKRMFHRKEGRIVKINDDLLMASFYAYMMRRYALPKAEARAKMPARYEIRDPLERFIRA